MTADDRHKTRRLNVTVHAASPAEVIARLQAVAGVDSARWRGPNQIEIRYDLDRIDFTRIRAELAALGVMPATTLPDRLRCGLWAYLEEIQRETDASPDGWDFDVQRIYVSRHRRRRHGYRDERPQQWRKYLDQPPAAEKS